LTQRQFDLTLGAIFLFNIAFFSVRLAAKRRVQQGQTTGIVGSVAQAVAVGA
jgi:hypothetical protein